MASYAFHCRLVGYLQRLLRLPIQDWVELSRHRKTQQNG